MVEAALDTLPDELTEEMRIKMCMEKKQGIGRDKLYRFLASRGFAYDRIYDAIEEVQQ